MKTRNREIIMGSNLNLRKSENLPSPLFAKEGYKSSLWQREDRRDFINNVVIMKPLTTLSKLRMHTSLRATGRYETISSND